MADQNKSIYLSQLRAMLKRNLLLKTREKRKTITEIMLPMYFLAILIVIKFAVPDPNIPEINTPRGEEYLFSSFSKSDLHKIIVAPNTTEVLSFITEVSNTWNSFNPKSKLEWIHSYETDKDVQDAYDKDPKSVPLAVIFDNTSDPIKGELKYQIRTNPYYVSTPSYYSIGSSILSCRGGKNKYSNMEDGSTCPANTYYFSGFLALQTLIDYTKIRLESKQTHIQIPDIFLEILPKAAATGSWSIAFRVVIPLYLVLALSQFITYLMILIVGEKEKKIKEGMKLMGLMDSVFWLSWFIIYASFVLFISIICILLLTFLKVLTCSNMLLIFVFILLYGFSVIMFAFMITPFFDKARTAGVLSSFILVLMSLFYYIQVFVSSKNPQYLWVLSLLSPAGFAMAMDKVVMLDVEGIGLSFSNMWDNHQSGVPFGGSLIMIIVDIILYGAVAYYLDSVIPSEHGVKRSPLFCFMPSFWTSRRSQIPASRSDPENSGDIEPVTREMQDKEAIRIIDMNKCFKQFRKPTVTALNGINMSIYEGQITAILGHNGAGKTTLFNILTGLVSPTSGSAYVFGCDVRNSNDMDKIRRMTGVCPQHDILFDNLTPKEHLQFYAEIKGIKDVKSAVEKTIREIDLLDKMNTPSSNLSGGQKRKLSIGIALIGDPKIIILDEPTAGVDPFSRRHLWNVLQNVRHGKVILLTTHFMDEADILADRKAVVSKGKIRCCGSSLFLKNKFGIGYHLTFVLEDDSNEHAINTLVKEHVKMAKMDRRHGKELSFILPHDAVEQFAPLFTAIEEEIKNKSNLGISSYGVSMTTLEEVFLSLQKQEEDGEEENNGTAGSSSVAFPTEPVAYRELKDSTDTLNHGNQTLSEDLRSLESINCTPNTSQNIRALIGLRLLRLRREKKKLWMVIFLPLLFAALGLYLNKSTDTTVSPQPKVFHPIRLDIWMYSYWNITFHNDDPSDSDALESFEKKLHTLGAQIDTDYNGSFSSLLDIAPHLSAFNINKFSTSNRSITVLYNDTMQHSLPVLLNLISNGFYRDATNSPFSQITLASYPFEIPSSSENTSPVSGGNFILGMIFLFAPILLAVDVVYDREIKARNQLRVNGLSSSVYFISFFLVQLVLLAIITGALIVLIILIKPPSLSSASAIIVLTVWVILYCPASILFTTCVSYLFDKTETAQSVMPNASILLGLIPYLPVMLAKESIARSLHYFFTFVDMMYVPYGILNYIQKVSLECDADKNCTEPSLSSFLIPEIIVVFISLIIQIPFWSLILAIVDVKKTGGNALDIFRSKKSHNIVEDANESRDIGTHEDQDVKHERERVKNLIRDPGNNRSVITVENLHKVYQTGVNSGICGRQSKAKGALKVAIKSVSLAVDSSEVFGLLGHNGAGKTTAMKIITAEEAPTRGRIQIAGNSITSSVNSAFQLLGYCPQHDAQWKNVTVKEHLELYSRIRGVPKNDIERVVNLYLTGLQIHEHKNKQAEKCSGGTRRKLSYAMAMVGNPKIVLLDEPSTGMDPKSKRFLWDTVLASFRGSKGAILTTHSMEEADALCSRVGIMVNGELRCLGSTQHLKNLYGAGYNLEIKLSVEDGADAEERFRNLKNFVMDLFPNAVLEETFGDRLMFSVPQESVPSLANCFRSLEEAKRRLNIEEYSFSQTTLEQVFLKFAHEGENEED